MLLLQNLHFELCHHPIGTNSRIQSVQGRVWQLLRLFLRTPPHMKGPAENDAGLPSVVPTVDVESSGFVDLDLDVSCQHFELTKSV